MSQRPLSAMEWLAMICQVGARQVVASERNNGRHTVIPPPVLAMIDALDALARAERGGDKTLTQGVTSEDDGWVSYTEAARITGKDRRTLQRWVSDGKVAARTEEGRTMLRRADLE